MTPSIDQALHQFLTLLLIWTVLPILTFYLIARVFHRAFATGAARQQRSCPTLGLASVITLRPISPEVALFPDFWISNIPRYFWFAFSFCVLWIIDFRHLCLQLTNLPFLCFRPGVSFSLHFIFPFPEFILQSGQVGYYWLVPIT